MKDHRRMVKLIKSLLMRNIVLKKFILGQGWGQISGLKMVQINFIASSGKTTYLSRGI